MSKRCLVIAAGAWLAACPLSGAPLDRIKKIDGRTVPGRVMQMSHLEVIVELHGAQTPIPVNKIASISYDDEPAQLKSVRTSVSEGRYNDALAALAKIDVTNVTRREILQDIQFYKALCAAKRALGGVGTIQDAGRMMIAFERANTGSYHYLEACEIVGDLLVAMQKYSHAEGYYDRIANTPWDDYKMRAWVKKGRALLAQPGKANRALAEFEKVLQSQATGKLVEAQKMAATLGKARCLVATGQGPTALKMINNVIANADPEQVGLHARAYNALGTSLRKAGRDKDALLAFLHVDILYNRLPDAHAEALYNLVHLLRKLQKPDRALRSRQLLKSQYGNTSWAKREG